MQSSGHALAPLACPPPLHDTAALHGLCNRRYIPGQDTLTSLDVEGLDRNFKPLGIDTTRPGEEDGGGD